MDMTYRFELVDVKDELVKALKVELPKFNLQNVKVIKSDPKLASEIPCIGINRGDDSETQQAIADFAGTSFDEPTQTLTTQQGTYFSESMEIRIWHTNADERDRVYHTVKGILFAIRPDLVKKGVMNISLRSGRDEQDSSGQNAPEVLYWGSLTMSYLNPLDVMYTQENVQPITSIIGNSNLNL